jgi:hypothetical protein
MATTLIESAPLAATPAAPAAPAAPVAPSIRLRWAGRLVSGIAVLFLTIDTMLKLVGVKEAVEGTVQLGFAPHHLAIIGMIEVACLALYLIPRTAPLGAVLWTGYFGGAIVTHLRLDNPLLSHTLFPIYVATLVWGGLYLRDARVRALLRAAR